MKTKGDYGILKIQVVSLVITIILLLILAGLSIQALTNVFIQVLNRVKYWKK